MVMSAPRYEEGRFVAPAPIPYQNMSHVRFPHSIVFLFQAGKNFLETFSQAHYEEPFLQYKFMGQIFNVVSDPDMIKYFMIENRQNYKMSPIRQKVLKPILGEGLITAEGEVWRHARHNMASMFTPRNVASFGEVMSRAAEKELKSLFEDGEVLSLAPLLSQLTYVVLSETLFSGEIEKNKAQMLQDVATTLLYMGRPDPLDIMGAPDGIPRLTRLRGLRSVKRLRRMIDKIIRERRAHREQGKALVDDFLSRLLLAKTEAGEWAFTNEQVEDHMLSFIGAGHETTARALVWMLYLLSNDPKAKEAIEAEVDSLDMEISPPDWPDHLPWTTACLEETMRLYPPAPMIARSAIEADKCGALSVPARSVMFINTWVLHRHKKLWEHPDRFIAERFFGEARGKIQRFQYLPFGAGERVCIGQRFAMQEALILIVHLLRNFSFEYSGQEPPYPKLRITVQPHNDMPMRVRRR